MIVILFAGLALTAVAVALIVRGASAPRTRAVETLDQIDKYGFTTPRGDEQKRGRLSSWLDAAAARTGEIASTQLRRQDEREIRNLLIAAGLFTLSPGRFTGYRVFAAVALPAVWAWVAAAGGLSGLVALLGIISFVIVGWMAPLWVVRTKARRRLERIDYDLPELIDLLVVTVEAGVGFVQSLQIAADRLGGPLGDELRLVIQEQAMGLAVNEALRNMLDRCETPAVRSFVRSILQGETLGVSIGQIMRNLAVEMRKRRKAAAEERAQKAPIKMLFPLVFLIFPAMFVILLGPAVFSFIKAFGG